MKIQFVCTRNTFRSRLAEAYLKSKKIPGLVVSSSGIAADTKLNGNVADYALFLLYKDKLNQYLSKTWRQTSKEDIEGQDLVIFMEPVHSRYCIRMLGARIPKNEVWNISDLNVSLSNSKSDDIFAVNKASEEIFKKIKEKIDQLVVTISPY